ncbi:hypothetical protein L1049_004042 [Liquidambar formosana]|uniref:Uncharacterized protein n=1 Tax=Liquidambar formosana TaxID=63359 RepID=A0AAP0RNF4_LIQFO
MLCTHVILDLTPCGVTSKLIVALIFQCLYNRINCTKEERRIEAAEQTAPSDQYSSKKAAKIESYAPSLSNAPIGSKILENELIVDPRKQEFISHLKTEKNFLRNQDLDKAFVEFNTALELCSESRGSY